MTHTTSSNPETTFIKMYFKYVDRNNKKLSLFTEPFANDFTHLFRGVEYKSVFNLPLTNLSLEFISQLCLHLFVIIQRTPAINGAKVKPDKRVR